VPVRVENADQEACDGYAYVITDEADVLALQSFLDALSEEAPDEAVLDRGVSEHGERLYTVFLDGEPVEVALGPGLLAIICTPAAELTPEEAAELTPDEAPEPQDEAPQPDEY